MQTLVSYCEFDYDNFVNKSFLVCLWVTIAVRMPPSGHTTTQHWQVSATDTFQITQMHHPNESKQWIPGTFDQNVLPKNQTLWINNKSLQKKKYFYSTFLFILWHRVYYKSIAYLICQSDKYDNIISALSVLLNMYFTNATPSVFC